MGRSYGSARIARPPPPSMPRAKKKKPVQRSLEESGQYPLLKKPSDCIGKNVGVPGSHWGSACPAADTDKVYLCTITDYTVLHAQSPTERWPALKLVEMGVDGEGGNSEAFWMRYPFPFLTFWYATYPLLSGSRTTEAPTPVDA